jgi:glutaminyl-tRNA synthetase
MSVAQITHFIKNIIDNDLNNNLHQQVVLRFPPEPNGFLHIGHAKSICLNFGLALDYQGECNLRLDDTNPLKENLEYIQSIQDSVAWLGFTPTRVTYASQYFDDFYRYALELINKGLAYVCFLNAEEVRQHRGTLTEPGTDSPYRTASIEDNLKHFELMKQGAYAEGHCVLRLKIDMASPFMVLRDPAIYRILHQPHHQTGDTWCMYPMYDFAHPISDALEHITHSLCTLEFQDNRRLYDWVLEHLDEFNRPDRPHQYEFSRLNLAYTVMSKHKLAQLVSEKKVSGWDDPRMPTISGLRRRGYTPEAIKVFAERIGISKVDGMTDMKILEDCVRDDLNIHAKRTMAVIDPLEVEITNFDGALEVLHAPNHPQNADFGTRDIHFSRFIYIDRADFMETAPNNKYKRLAINKEVRLRNAYVINATHCDRDSFGTITKIYATYDKDTLGKNPSDGRKVKGVIHFVEKTTAVAAEFRVYDRLFSVEKPGEDDAINPDSLLIQHGVVEPHMVDANAGEAYQFEREGYFCRDRCCDADQPLIFNRAVSLMSKY